MQQSPGVFVPIVGPREQPPTIRLSMLAEGEEPEEFIDVPPEPAPVPAAPIPGEDLRQQSRRDFILWGGLGVVAGAALNAGITAMAFRSYRRNQSIMGPALVSGLGSMAVGGLLLFSLSRAFTKSVDNRVTYAAVGAKLATY